MQDSNIFKPGALAKFSVCKRTNSDENYATKVTKKKKISHTNMASQLVIEKNALATIKSTFSVQLLYSLQPIPSVYSIMGYMVGRDLMSVLRVHANIQKSISDFYNAELSPAYKYLLSHGILKKNNIKPDNIFLTIRYHVKLTDFSLGEISTLQEDVQILSDELLERIKAWNKIHCEFSYCVRYKRISHSSKKYRTMLLFKALKNCKTSLVKQLLNSGVYIKGVTPCCRQHNQGKDCFHSLLMVNAIYGNSDITRMLIHCRCDLNIATICGITALHLAIGFNKRDIAMELIRSGADVHLKTKLTSSTALHLAIVRSTHIDDTKKILIKNSYFLRVMKYIWDFLCSIVLVRAGTIGKRSYECGRKYRVCLYLVKKLLDSGADVNYKDMYGCSAIHYAALTGNLELMKILIEAGAEINSQSQIGATALHHAVLIDDEEIVLLLLNNGADITIKTYQHNDSALHWAASLFYPIIDQPSNTGYRCESVLRKLLEHGGNVNEKNANKKTIINVGCYPQSIILYVAEVEARMQMKVFDDYNLANINGRENIKVFYKKIQAELTAMRNDKIKNTAISYLSILTEPLEEVASWVKNEEFLKNFDTHYCKITYPSYAAHLKEKIAAATKRKKKSVRWHDKVELSCDV